MPDDNSRTQAIENRIDRGIADAMLPAPSSGGVLNLVPRNMGEAMEFGKLMAVSGGCVRPAFRNNPGMCLAIALQAWRNGGDPFAYANHAYIVNDQLAFEAKLINAIVNTRAPLVARLRTSYSGEGQNRRCKVVGILRGEEEPAEYESPKIADIKVKNSPLWVGDPDQQLHYFSVRAWARRHVPEILLGIYSVDEVGEMIDATPLAGIEDHARSIAQAEPEPAPPVWEVYDHVGEVYEFKTAENAVAACRKILIAAAADPQALATAWDNNASLLQDVGDMAEPLYRLYAELAPQEARPEPEAPPLPGEDRPFAPPATEPANTAGSSDTTARGQANSPAGHGPTATTPASPSEVAPGPHNTPAAQEQGSAQTAERHDPFWDGQTLRIDPPLLRGQGLKKDWKVWPALVKPRIRQAWATATLNALYQDNADHLNSYGSACGERERDEMVAEFDAARDRLSND